MAFGIVNSRVYSNPYQKLLYRSIGSRYRIASGSIATSVGQLNRLGKSIHHIHWEEALFSKCESASQAGKLRRNYVAQLKRYVDLGGKVVWTIHNIKPHEWRFTGTFLSLRKDLAALSSLILVHSQHAASMLQAQIGAADMSKVRVLAHPTYFDVYEPAEKTIELAGQPPAHPRTLLYFGLVRAYKGIPEMLRKLPHEFMVKHDLALRICGHPMRAESFLDDLLAQCDARPEIECRLESIPTPEVADLLRSCAGLILPYHKVLTSGVAVLSLTLGVPTVAPKTPAMEELFPESSHHLLFNPRSSNDLRRAVLALANMSPEMRMRISQDYLERAQACHPRIISRRLGAIYDKLLGIKPNKKPAAGGNAKPAAQIAAPPAAVSQGADALQGERLQSQPKSQLQP